MRFLDRLKASIPSCLIALTLLASGVATADEIASNAIIDRAGLTVEWYTHSGIGPAGSLVDWHMNVNEDKATTFFTITSNKGYRETFSQNKLNAFGKPMGIDGGVEYANLRKDVLTAEYENEGFKDIKIDITQYKLPETTIYAMTSDGTVRAIDAETGETRWKTRVGLASLPCVGLGSCDQYVAAVNGTTVYCLDAASGKSLWSAKCRDLVSAPPAISEDKIYVPLSNGRLEAFNITERGDNSLAFVDSGAGTARPTVTGKTVAWTNNRGNMNVAGRFGARAISYQLLSDDAIVAAPAYQSGTYFVASLDGFVYSIDETLGSVNWQVSTGREVMQSPVLLGNYLFVINEKNELFKLNQKDGNPAPGWQFPKPNIAKMLGAGKDNLYVLDRFGKLIVINQKNGSELTSVEFGEVDKVLANHETDRMYVVSKRGMIQCIREIARPVAYFHFSDFGPVEMEAARSGGTQGAAPGEERAMSEADLSDPFRALEAQEEDPFANPGNKAEEDPFGGAGGAEKDPFGGAGNKSEDDPFGGSGTQEDDPFK